MKIDCTCSYCKNKVNEYFCIICMYDFNACESFFELKDKRFGSAPIPGIQLCPKCHPKEWNPTESVLQEIFLIAMKNDN